MIPDFNEHGYLPAGIHRATLAEIEERFGRASEIRRTQMQSLVWLVEGRNRGDPMILRSQAELENTRKKLQMLEEQYEAARRDSDRDEYLRDLELQSLKGLINQLKEEIARFECRATGTHAPRET